MILLLAASVAYGSSAAEMLNGKWKCVRERDRAKIVAGYMESVVFAPDELTLFYQPGPPIRCRYAVGKGVIRATNRETGEKWNFGFKFLENGDLYLRKGPWSWEGWFSRDFERPRAEDPRDPKRTLDYLRRKNENK